MNNAKLNSLEGFMLVCPKCNKGARKILKKRGRLREKRLWKKQLDTDTL